MTLTSTLVSSSAGSGQLPMGLPVGSELLPVVFTGDRNKGQRLLHALPIEFQTFAVVGQSDGVADGDPSSKSARQIEFLTVPVANHQATELHNSAVTWVDASTTSKAPRQMMTLQGAQIFWNDTRVAILAAPERLEAARNALIETCWYDAELTSLEHELATAWPEMQKDAPLAFAFDEKSLPRRNELQSRYVHVVSIRSRMLRLSSHVYSLHVHPPTLASQVGERFRERVRLLHRHEILDDQLEVFESVYDTCGQRMNDFIQSRTGHMLEWIIIALIVFQIVIWSFEILTSLEPSAITQ